MSIVANAIDDRLNLPRLLVREVPAPEVATHPRAALDPATEDSATAGDSSATSNEGRERPEAKEKHRGNALRGYVWSPSVGALVPAANTDDTSLPVPAPSNAASSGGVRPAGETESETPGQQVRGRQ